MPVFSDIDVLSKVLIHEPDLGIEYVTPEIAEQLLYDDIVFLPRIIEEHFEFTQCLRQLIGKDNVLEFQDLLEDVLKNEITRNNLLEDVSVYHKLNLSKIEKLRLLNDKHLSETLVSGLLPETLEVVLPPLPNLVFTRDLCCIVEGYLILCKAQKAARQRENILFKYIVNNHPEFSAFKNKIIDFTTPEFFQNGAISIEGGDIMPIGNRHLLIGKSERTTLAALEILKAYLFENNVIDKLTVVELPEARYCMHLDTVFTFIDKNICVGFAPLVFDENDHIGVISYSIDKSNPIFFPTLKALLLEEYPDIKLVPCGSGLYPFDEREQWTDGCNFVAIKPGVAIAYERNTYTIKAFKEIGFSSISAKRLSNFDAKLLLERTEKTIITIPSSELSRARGGPHCMTMPISRS